MQANISAQHATARVPVVRDWPTLGLFVACIGVWFGALALAGSWPWLSFVVVVLTLVLHASLSHEMLHGSPFSSEHACTALGLFQPGLVIPYLRFKRTHLAHHMDANLTDPYDDPETNYLDPAVWAAMPAWQQRVLQINNTLIGRMVIGPVVGQWGFMRGDLARVWGGDRQVALDWLLHVPGTVVVLVIVAASPMSVWTYLGAVYGALAILKIRTFLEHCAHERCSGRTAIVEDRGLLGFLFLNNNLHVVHHMHPTVAWYRLPALYRSRKERYRARNGGYVFTSYGAIFRQYLWRSKDPVPHPLWRGRGD